MSAGQQQQFLNATNAAGLGIYQSSEQTAAATNKESQQQQVLNAHQAIDRVKHMHELKMRRELAIKLQARTHAYTRAYTPTYTHADTRAYTPAHTPAQTPAHTPAHTPAPQLWPCYLMCQHFRLFLLIGSKDGFFFAAINKNQKALLAPFSQQRHVFHVGIILQGADKTGDILKSNISSEDEDKIRHNLMYKKIDDIKEFQDKTKMVAQQIVLESQNQDNSDPDLLFVREILNEHRSENMKFFKKVVNKCKRNKSNPRKKFQRRSSKKKHSI